jgi:hypothetical protein
MVMTGVTSERDIIMGMGMMILSVENYSISLALVGARQRRK